MTGASDRQENPDETLKENLIWMFNLKLDPYIITPGKRKNAFLKLDVMKILDIGLIKKLS